MYLCMCVTPPGQTKNDTDLKFGTHTTIDLQEKGILLYMDREHGVKFVIVQNLTSEMTEAGG